MDGGDFKNAHTLAAPTSLFHQRGKRKKNMDRGFKTMSAFSGGRLFKTLASPLRPAQVPRLNNNESKLINTRLAMTTQGLKSSKHTSANPTALCYECRADRSPVATRNRCEQLMDDYTTVGRPHMCKQLLTC